MYKIVKNTTPMKTVKVNKKDIQIPENWSVEKIGDIYISCDNKRTIFNRTVRDKIQGKYPYYGSTGIVDYINKYGIDGTYGLIGEDAAPFLDKKKRVSFLINGRFSGNNHAHVFQTQERFNLQYVIYALNKVNFRPFVSGSTRLKLTKTELERIQIATPPTNDQIRIASYLSLLESSVSKAKQLIDFMETEFRYYQSELLSGRMIVKNNEIVENTTPMKTVKVNKKDVQIPEDWNLLSLKNVGITIKTGNQDVNVSLESGNYPFFSCSGKQKRFVNSYNFNGESILVTGNGDPGAIKYYNGKFDAYQRVYVLQDGNNMLFLKFQMEQNFKKQISAIGSVIKYIRMEDFINYRFASPPTSDEQNQIAFILSKYEDDIKKMKDLLEEQKQTFQWASKALLSGEYIVLDD